MYRKTTVLLTLVEDLLNSDTSLLSLSGSALKFWESAFVTSDKYDDGEANLLNLIGILLLIFS